MKRLYKKESVASYLQLATEARRADSPLCSVWQSEAWQSKVVVSGFAARYPRGLVLHLSADGTCPFYFGSHSIWPIYAEVIIFLLFFILLYIE